MISFTFTCDPKPRRLRQENLKFEANLGYRIRLFLQIQGMVVEGEDKKKKGKERRKGWRGERGKERKKNRQDSSVGKCASGW